MPPSLLNLCFKSIAENYLIGNAKVSRRNILPIELIEHLLLNENNYLMRDQLNDDAFIKVLELSDLPSLSLSYWNITNVALNALDGKGLLAIRLDNCYHLEEEDIVALASRAPHLKTLVLLNLTLSQENLIKIASSCPSLTELKVRSDEKILHELANKCLNLEKLSIQAKFQKNWNDEIDSLLLFNKLSFFRLKGGAVDLNFLVTNLPKQLSTLELCKCKEALDTNNKNLASEKSKSFSNLTSLVIEHCDFEKTSIDNLLGACAKINQLVIRGSGIEQSILNRVVYHCKNLTKLELIFRFSTLSMRKREKALLDSFEKFKSENKNISEINFTTIRSHLRNESSGSDTQVDSPTELTDTDIEDIPIQSD